MKVRQDRLGHVNGEEITLGIYTHCESVDHETVAERLGKLLAPMDEQLSEGAQRGQDLCPSVSKLPNMEAQQERRAASKW